jgi:hypothetical protein
LGLVHYLISWKHSFRRLGEEYEVARKKKQALDTLLDTGRISQSTHDLFSVEIAESMTDIERQQKTMTDKMNAKIVELEEQVKTLEILLANFEIQHVTGEVDDEVYQREIAVLSVGLETSRNELDAMKDAADQLSRGNFFESELKVEDKVIEEIPKPKMAYVEVNTAEEQNQVSSCTACAEEAKQAETAAQNEEKTAS